MLKRHWFYRSCQQIIAPIFMLIYTSFYNSISNMRVVIQRVNSASVVVEGETLGQISKGLLIFVCVEEADAAADTEWLVQKITNLRIFSDQAGAMNLSVKDIEGQILVVSQFTLHSSTKKGNRPSFIRAAKPEIAIPVYEAFILSLRNFSGLKIETGRFGADMKISLLNDGPVTIIMDTKNKE
jgi:D-aminoacyl-tRNA deacylase